MMWYFFCCFFCRTVLTLGCGLKIRVRGAENFPRRGGFILAGNHASNLDPMVFGFSCPRKLNYMAKEELFRHKLFGAVLHSVGAFPIKRGTADLGAIRTAFGRVRKGEGLLLFPQGGRRPLNDASEPEPGVGMLSQRLAVPIVPAYVTGTDRALPPGSSKVKKGCRIEVRFGKPMMLEPGKDYQKSASQIMKAIRSLAGG